MNTQQKLQIVGAAVLLLCLLPLPFGFYTIVKIVITVLSGYFAYNYFAKNKKELALAFLVITLIFQPFIKIVLGREVWLVVDVSVAILLLVLALKKK